MKLAPLMVVALFWNGIVGLFDAVIFVHFLGGSETAVGAEAFPAGLLLFLMPFNCVGLGLMGNAIAAIWKLRGGLDEAPDELRARYIRVDTGDHVVFGKKRMPTATVFLIALGSLSFLATFAVIFPLGFEAPMEVVVAVILACAAIAGYIAWIFAKRGRSPEKFLHVDRQRGTFSFPADAPGAPLESIQSILVENKKTGVVINDVRQYKHTFEVETPKGPVKLFEVSTSMDEGEEVLDLLRLELLR